MAVKAPALRAVAVDNGHERPCNFVADFAAKAHYNAAGTESRFMITCIVVIKVAKTLMIATFHNLRLVESGQIQA